MAKSKMLEETRKCGKGNRKSKFAFSVIQKEVNTRNLAVFQESDTNRLSQLGTKTEMQLPKESSFLPGNFYMPNVYHHLSDIFKKPLH